jgi:MSHA biogenesis protein MshI
VNWTLDPRRWFIKKVSKPNGVVGLSVSEHGVSISHGEMINGEFKLLKLDFEPIQGPGVLPFVQYWVSKNKLKNADCHYVLDKTEYELELVETPPVEDDELREAVRWRLKDLISIPIEETVIDIFPLPDDAYRGRMKMLYVVAVHRAVIESKLKFIRSCGLDPKVIDIEEMALRNISLHLPDMEKGTIAILSLKENSGEILMFSHEDMYLSRSIEMGYASLIENDEHNNSLQSPLNNHSEYDLELRIDEHGEESNDHDRLMMLDRFILDVQRSLDYYESQLGKGIASKVYLLPTGIDGLKLQKPMQDALSPRVVDLECKKFIPMSEDINFKEIEEMYLLPVIGAVLRRQA